VFLFFFFNLQTSPDLFKWERFALISGTTLRLLKTYLICNNFTVVIIVYDCQKIGKLAYLA